MALASKGGGPRFDPVAMIEVLVQRPQHNLSDAPMESRTRPGQLAGPWLFAR